MKPTLTCLLPLMLGAAHAPPASPHPGEYRIDGEAVVSSGTGRRGTTTRLTERWTRIANTCKAVS